MRDPAVISKSFDEVNIVTARARTAHGTIVIITFGEEGPEATLPNINL